MWDLDKSRTNNLKRPEHIKCDGKKAVMGILIELWKGGEIHVGDEVFVAQWFVAVRCINNNFYIVLF